VAQREGFVKRAYQGADETMRLAQDLLGKRNLTTIVGSDHGFAPQFLAIDASKVLVDLGLLSKPQTSNCRPATAAAGETKALAKACWAGGTAQIYLNVKDRDPAVAGKTQIAQADVDATVAKIRQAYALLQDPNDWTRDGRPEHWKLIDRMYTKAEARYVPNGPHSTADMSHATRTGDLVVFSYPPYEFDAATPGTLVARSAFFGQHGYVPDVQDLRSNTNMRATFIADGPRIRHRTARDVRSIDVAPTAAFVLGMPEPQNSQGVVRRDLFEDRHDYKPISIIGLNDFHGQLEQTTGTIDGLAQNLGGAPQLATLFDEEKVSLPGPALLLAAGDNVGASPPNSALLDDMPTIDVENAWGLDATSFGNHEFDYGPARILAQEARAAFPWLSANIVEESTGRAPSYIQPSAVFRVKGVRVGVIGATVHTTPELVAAGNTEGLLFLDEAQRIKAESQRLRAQGVNVQVVVIHEGASLGANATGNTVPASPWQGPIIGIVQALQDTTIDLVIAGHTHRAANTVVGHIPVVEGFNAGASYSVAQLFVKDGDVAWTGATSRTAKNIGVKGRSDIQAIVDQANAVTAPLRNRVIGTQSVDILRDPSRLSESAMGNLVADAMLAKYPEAEAVVTNSGGLRQDIRIAPPSASEQPGQITWGEVFAVLPFNNRAALVTLTADQLRAGLLNGVSPACDANIATGRFPQVAGLKIRYHCNGTTAVLDSVTRADGSPLPATIRIVTNDFMLTGGDGYTAFMNGTDVQQPDSLLEVTIEYITAHSPVAPKVEDRTVKG
jgi:2',3'-cyclic-nucleotide 2'-phosphodiesterase (5'-nucleotidase family)